MSQDKRVPSRLSLRKRGLSTFAVIAALSAALGGSRVLAGEEASASCGAPGEPPCPLQEWMRRRVAAPLASNDMAALAAALDESAAMSPDPGWAEWASTSKSGAEAARAGNIRAVRASCTDCHRLYKKTYRDKYRARPIP